MSGSEMFYEEGGKRADAAIHDAILSEGQDVTSVGMKYARKAGLTDAEVALLYGDDAVAKYDPSQPRDDIGRWTDTGGGLGTAITGGVAELKAKQREWSAAGKGRSLEEIMAAAPAQQDELAKVGDAVAKEQGLEFKNPGIKKNIERIREKMAQGGKGPHEITDIVRGAIVVDTAAQADAVVRSFSKRFPTIDEGWRTTDGGYIDRPLKIRLDDGSVGEVQILERHMAKAKGGLDNSGGGGHDLYVKARSLPDGNPEKPKLVQKMRRMYGHAAMRSHGSFAGLFANA